MEIRPERKLIRSKAKELGIRYVGMYSNNLINKYRVKIYAYSYSDNNLDRLVEYATEIGCIEWVDKPLRYPFQHSLNLYFHGGIERW